MYALLSGMSPVWELLHEYYILVVGSMAWKLEVQIVDKHHDHSILQHPDVFSGFLVQLPSLNGLFR
jgi:hypothetical protein